VALGGACPFAAPFVWRCLSGSAVAPFPHPPHRTGHADFLHPALGQDLTPSSTTRRAQAGSDVRARSARRGARVDTQINGDATELLFASSGRADGADLRVGLHPEGS
jgi:hypothetical protein